MELCVNIRTCGKQGNTWGFVTRHACVGDVTYWAFHLQCIAGIASELTQESKQRVSLGAVHTCPAELGRRVSYECREINYRRE